MFFAKSKEVKIFSVKKIRGRERLSFLSLKTFGLHTPIILKVYLTTPPPPHKKKKKKK